MSTLPGAFLTRVQQEFPADLLSTDPSELAEYGRDWTKVYAPAPSAIALPRTTDEVSRLVNAAIGCAGSACSVCSPAISASGSS